MAKERIKLTEGELMRLISEAVKEEMASEAWLGRTFGGKESRGNTQIADAMKLIQQSDQLIAQFRQAMQQGGQQQQQQAQAFGGQQNTQQNTQQQPVNEGEMNELVGQLLGYALGKQGGNFLAGKGDKNYQLVSQAYKLRSDAYAYIARAVANGVQLDFSKFEDKLLGVKPNNAQAASGQQQNNQQQGGQATNWKQAEAEINQVVKGNFSGWPQKCKQAGWPDEKIQAYRKLANSASGGNGGAQQNNQQAQTQTTGQAANNTAAPAQGQQQQQVAESVISRIVTKFATRK